jgi:hypothetical protein
VIVVRIDDRYTRATRLRQRLDQPCVSRAERLEERFAVVVPEVVDDVDEEQRVFHVGRVCCPLRVGARRLHLTSGRTAPLVHAPAALLQVDGNRLGGVHRRLRRLELFALFDERPRLFELLTEGFRAWVALRRLGRRPPPAEPAKEDDGSERAGDPREAVHGADATLRAASCLVSRRPSRAALAGEAA